MFPTVTTAWPSGRRPGLTVNMSSETKTNNILKHKRKQNFSDSVYNNDAKIMKQTQTPSTSRKAQAIPTFNRYAHLSDDENDEPIVQTTKPNHPKIPPIVVEQMTFVAIKETMRKIGIPQTAYCTKYISIGIKIFIRDIENYKKAIKELTDSKQIGFTHDLPSEKTSKFVLSGLPVFSIDYLKEGLQDHNLQYLDVKNYEFETNSIPRAGKLHCLLCKQLNPFE